MILARLRRVRRIFAVAALLCTWVAAFGPRDAGVAGERRIRERVVAQGEMMSAARSAIVEVGRLVSQDRGGASVFLAPHGALPVVGGDARGRSAAPLRHEIPALARPRRLAFGYEANAPPSAL